MIGEISPENFIDNFYNSSGIKKNQDKIIKYLLGRDYVKRIEDVRAHVSYQNDDIDILIVNKYGKRLSCKIETDSRTTAHFFYETLSCVETGTIGYPQKTMAEYILYYFEKSNKLYILPTQAFCEFFKVHKHSLLETQVKKRRDDGTLYTSEGYLIPVDILEKEMSSCRVHEL